MIVFVVILLFTYFVMMHIRYRKLEKIKKSNRNKRNDVDVCSVTPDWTTKVNVWSKLNLPFKVHMVTYGDEKYDKTLYRLYKSACDSHWFDSVTAFRKSMLSPFFVKEFQHIL